jgi:hypothetical protein
MDRATSSTDRDVRARAVLTVKKTSGVVATLSTSHAGTNPLNPGTTPSQPYAAT